MTDSNIKDKVFLDRVNMFFGHAGKNILNGLLGGVLICTVLYYSGTSLRDIAIWFAGLCIASAITFFVDYIYKKQQLTSENANSWLKRRILAGSLIALAWSISPFLLSSQGGFEAELVLFIILSTLVVLASIGYSVMPSYYLILNVIVLWPFTISFFHKLDTLHIVTIITSILWQILILSKALIVSRSTIEGLHTKEQLQLEIAGRIKVEEALKENEKRLELAIETSQIGLYDWNFVTGDAFFDENWMNMLGYEHNELPHNFDTWGELIHPDDKDIVLEHFNAHLEGKTPYMEVIERLRKKNGEWFWILDRAKVIQKDKTGKPLRIMGTHLDINQRKLDEEKIKNQNNELAELNATKDKFFSIIAHDLKSPFNAILGFSDILLEKHKKYDDEEREEIIKIIKSSANNAYTLLGNLLTWSSSQSGRIDYCPEEIHLKILLFEAMSDLKAQAVKKEIQILETISEKETIIVDGNMIATVFRNLISNAIKFTSKNGTIVISSEKQKDSNFIEISVSDTGVGIPKDNIDDLFRIDKNTSTYGTEKETGTGLGLILCKEFIEKHGGKIWVVSEVGKGSDFKFTIPLNKSE